MYSLLTLLAVIVAGSFVETFVRHRRGYLPVFSVSLAASLYTHNWALFLGLMCGVAFLFCVYEQRTVDAALWRDGLIGFGVTAVCSTSRGSRRSPTRPSTPERRGIYRRRCGRSRRACTR